MNWRILFTVLTVVLAPLASAGDDVEEPKAKKKKKSSGDFMKTLKKNKWPRLYRDKDGFVERVNLIGRIDYQGSHYDWNGGEETYFGLRRLRLGLDVDFAEDWRLKVMGGFLSGGEVEYNALDSAYLRYQYSKRLKFRLGKQVPKFGQEWSTPSMDLRVIERSLLTQQVRPRRATGFVVEHDGKDFDWDVGIFSGDRSREFGDLDSGLFTVIGLHVDLEDIFGIGDNFDWNFYHMYQEADLNNSQSKGYGHSYSTGFEFRGR